MEDVHRLIKLEPILGGLEGFPNPGRLFVLLNVLPIGHRYQLDHLVVFFPLLLQIKC